MSLDQYVMSMDISDILTSYVYKSPDLFTNHTLIGEYYCCFFSQEENICLEMNACPYKQAQSEIIMLLVILLIFCKVIYTLFASKIIFLTTMAYLCTLCNNFLIF